MRMMQDPPTSHPGSFPPELPPWPPRDAEQGVVVPSRTAPQSQPDNPALSLRTLLVTWLRTVAIGSLTAPLAYVPIGLMADSATFGKWGVHFPFWIAFTGVISCMYSVPAVLLLIATNEVLRRRKGCTSTTFTRVFMTTFLLMSAVTFGLLLTEYLHQEPRWVSTCAVVFTGTGWILWHRACRSGKMRSRS